MVPGTSVLLTFVMPFPLSLWGVPTSVHYSFQTRNAANVLLSSSLTIVLTDANPSYTLNFTFPIGVTDFIRMNPGGSTFFFTPILTVWKRTVTNIFALAMFDSWFLNAASVGTWQSNYPNSLTLTEGTTVNWIAAGQTGSTDLFSSYAVSTNGFTLAARWSTSTAGCNATSDFVDTFVATTVSAECQTNKQPRRPARQCVAHGVGWSYSLLCACACVDSSQPCPDVPQRE